jgi:hypothetical protein
LTCCIRWPTRYERVRVPGRFGGPIARQNLGGCGGPFGAPQPTLSDSRTRRPWPPAPTVRPARPS